MCYGSEFIATAVQKWLGQIGVTTLYITPVAYLILGRFATPNAERMSQLERDLKAAEAAGAAPAE